MSVLKSKGSKSSDKQFAPRTNGISDNESEDGPWLTTIDLSRHETRNGSDNNMNGWGQHAYMLILCESNVISWSRVGSPLLYFQSILLYSCLFCVAASFFWRHHYHQPRPKRCYWQSSSTTGCHWQSSSTTGCHWLSSSTTVGCLSTIATICSAVHLLVAMQL